MTENEPNQGTVVDRFWDTFKACLEEKRVGSHRSTFYVKRAQGFVDFVPGDTLAETWATEKSGLKGMSKTIGSPFQDHVVPGEIEWLFSSLPHALKTEVKGRYDAVGEKTL